MKPKVIGIVGGIASGKTFVARQLEMLGAVVLDADAAGHEVLRRPEIKAAARSRWGDAIFGPDGEIHRPRLAAIVFAPPPAGTRELAHLEQLTHPAIREVLRAKLAEFEKSGPVVAVLDAPVMIKAGWDGFCDRIVYVDAPRAVRLARALRRGWSQEEFDCREAAQESLAVKREVADAVIDNSGSPEATERQTRELWEALSG